MPSTKTKYIVFSLEGVRYALDLAQVAEVGDEPSLWPIPLAPPCYSGAANFHGDIIAVINLAALLGCSNDSKPGKLIVLRQDIAALAFLVDMLIKIVPSDDVVLCKPADNLHHAGATFNLNDGNVILLDLASLVNMAESVMHP